MHEINLLVDRTAPWWLKCLRYARACTLLEEPIAYVVFKGGTLKGFNTLSEPFVWLFWGKVWTVTRKGSKAEASTDPGAKMPRLKPGLPPAACVT